MSFIVAFILVRASFIVVAAVHVELEILILNIFLLLHEIFAIPHRSALNNTLIQKLMHGKWHFMQLQIA